MYCKEEKPKAPKVKEEKISISTSNKTTVIPTVTEPIQGTKNKYPWQEQYDFKNALKAQIPTPKGYNRINVNSLSFADWLQYLPLKNNDSKVYLYNGELKSRQNVHHRVVDIDIGKRDLQQCADAVMRLKAEYNYSRKDFENIHFNFTSGDRVSFDDWRKGKKPIIKGNKIQFSSATNTSDNSYKNFKKYLTQIFSYAGTASLSKELKSIPTKEMQIGDIFIQGGFPGHAILVMDMAENEKGEKVFLLSQSYMPAQNIHILKNFNNENLSPWYSLDFGNKLLTPEWTFSKNDLKRF